MIDFSRFISPEARAESAALEARTVRVPVLRTRLSRDSDVETTDVAAFRVERRFFDGADWIHIVDGGATGHESMPLDHLDEAIAADGWLACFGTPGRWDRLVVPATSLQELCKQFEKLGMSTEYVDGEWIVPGVEGPEPQGLILFSTVDGPELPAGWAWWALGKIGTASSYKDARANIERHVASRGSP